VLHRLFFLLKQDTTNQTEVSENCASNYFVKNIQQQQQHNNTIRIKYTRETKEKGKIKQETTQQSEQFVNRHYCYSADTQFILNCCNYNNQYCLHVGS